MSFFLLYLIVAAYVSGVLVYLVSVSSFIVFDSYVILWHCNYRSSVTFFFVADNYIDGESFLALSANEIEFLLPEVGLKKKFLRLASITHPVSRPMQYGTETVSHV